MNCGAGRKEIFVRDRDSGARVTRIMGSGPPGHDQEPQDDCVTRHDREPVRPKIREENSVLRTTSTPATLRPVPSASAATTVGTVTEPSIIRSVHAVVVGSIEPAPVSPPIGGKIPRGPPGRRSPPVVRRVARIVSSRFFTAAPGPVRSHHRAEDTIAYSRISKLDDIGRPKMKCRAGVSDHADDDIVTNLCLRERDDILLRHQRERIPYRRAIPVAIPRILRRASRGREGKHKDSKSRCCTVHIPSLLPAGDQADKDRTTSTLHGQPWRQENYSCTETCDFGWGVMVVKRNPYSTIYLTS